MPTVRGTLEPPPGTPATPTTVRITVEDVTRADAAATIVAEQTLHSVSLPDLRFAISVDTVDPTAHYTVRARAQLPDTLLLTTQSIPVLTHGAPTEVTVPLTRA
jgi:uncharacterized lipoprotein YbaY